MAKEPEIPAVNLQDFVTEALVQIVEGVKAAQVRAAASGAKINPMNSVQSAGVPRHSTTEYGNDEEYGQIIEFDIAVAAVDKQSLKGGIGVISGLFNAGYKAEKGGENSSISRLKFSVPVFLPQQQVEIDPAKGRMGNQGVPTNVGRNSRPNIGSR